MSKFVPYLSEDQIERDAAALLAEYARKRGVIIKPPIPIDDIVEKYLKLGIEFDDTHKLFGVPRYGSAPDILGALFFEEARIVIDESLDPEENPAMEPRYRFTLGHEGGGHWRLHRHLIAKDSEQTTLLEKAVPSVVCRSSQAKERIEWQADYYASCVLMPKGMVLNAWQMRFGSTEPIIFELMRDRVKIYPPGGPKFRGRDEVLQETECDDFMNGWASIFAPVFGVSLQAMRIRLEKLGLLCRAVPAQCSFAI